MTLLPSSLVSALALLALCAGSSDYEISSLPPNDCKLHAALGDHLFVDYQIRIDNNDFEEGIGDERGALSLSAAKGNGGTKSFSDGLHLFHIPMPAELIEEAPPVYKALLHACLLSTTTITWKFATKAKLQPIYNETTLINSNATSSSLKLTITIHNITTHTNYQIFDALKAENLSLAMDLIQSRIGTNAVDEWGQTPLMVAIVRNFMPVVSALFNAVGPSVDVNYAKPSGYSAIFYSVDNKNTDVLAALLKRGANPNISLREKSSLGNTPLHFACLLEKPKHAELLLRYGANPLAKNQHGQVPLQLLPDKTVQSTRLYFKKMFDQAVQKGVKMIALDGDSTSM